MPEELNCAFDYGPGRPFTSNICYTHLQLGAHCGMATRGRNSNFNSFTPKAHLPILPPPSSSSQWPERDDLAKSTIEMALMELL